MTTTAERPRDTPPARPRPAAAGDGTAEEQAGEAVMGLDMVLVDAARGPLRRMVPPARTLAALGTSLARRPDAVGGRLKELAEEVGRIAVGRSEIAPSPKDRRFADPAWSGNPLLKRTMQAHIAAAQVAA